MKILFIYSNMIGLSDIPWALIELGIEVDVYDEKIMLQNNIMEEKEQLSIFIKGKGYDAVITHNFSETVSNACLENNTKYISWVFDSPLWELYKEAAWNENNYIFVFDKKQFHRLQQKNFPHLFYQPLATNITRASILAVTKEDEQLYGCDISFVGSLYEENDYNKNVHQLPDQIKEYFNTLITKHLLKWDKENNLIGSITKNWYDALTQWIYMPVQEKADQVYFIETCYLARKAAEIERVCILNALALSHKVDCYTWNDGKNLEQVKVHGAIDYETIAPKVFNLSKINLNITIRSIESGVPQRVYDIMSVGGFVLTNYQEELEELFVLDKEIVCYHTMEDLIYKVNYYLKNEQERVRIAMSGYQKVKTCYSYPVVVQKIIDKVKE